MGEKRSGHEGTESEPGKSGPRRDFKSRKRKSFRRNTGSLHCRTVKGKEEAGGGRISLPRDVEGCTLNTHAFRRTLKPGEKNRGDCPAREGGKKKKGEMGAEPLKGFRDDPEKVVGERKMLSKPGRELKLHFWLFQGYRCFWARQIPLNSFPSKRACHWHGLSNGDWEDQSISSSVRPSKAPFGEKT